MYVLWTITLLMDIWCPIPLHTFHLNSQTVIHRLYAAVVKYIILSKMLKLKRDRKLHLRHCACTAVFSRNICSMPTKLLIKDVQKSHDHWKWSDLHSVHERPCPSIRWCPTHRNHKILSEGDDYFSLVTVNFAGSICYIKCHSGFVSCKHEQKKNAQSAKLNESAKLCSHLQTCYANIDTIMRDFPQYFNESDDIIDDNKMETLEKT